ncbi:MAG: hypothetical protein HY748_03585 [Elusimicrobia bacterium]|nr:hypothetical protein [Elusimicrobiota bacterium]
MRFRLHEQSSDLPLVLATGLTSDLMGLAAGFGVKALGMSLDYSMTPFGGLGNSHRVSLGAKF